MSFNILDCLKTLETYGPVTENSTWIEATCPVCGGKLKITKNPSKLGAYGCYTNECHRDSKIRNVLYRKMPFRPSKAFTITKTKTVKLAEIISPIAVKATAKSFLTDVKFIAPKQEKLEDGKTYTYFLYEGFRVVRLDTIDSEGNSKKYIHPEYLPNPDGEYIKGIPSNLSYPPIYRDIYIQSSMVFVEGEKTATVAQYMGLAAATLPTMAYSEKPIEIYAKYLAAKGVENVLYLMDNDIPGKHKATLFRNAFNKYGIGCNVINLASDIYKEYKDWGGFDLCDAYNQYLVNNVEEFIDSILNLSE
jgi:hypothetical protein